MADRLLEFREVVNTLHILERAIKFSPKLSEDVKEPLLKSINLCLDGLQYGIAQLQDEEEKEGMK